MKYLIPCFALLFAFSSCKQYTQLYRTKPLSNIKVIDDVYVYETDTVKITYNFWFERGLMSYTIYNKLNIPLYVDWKKTSYIKNNDKLDCWSDVQTTNTEGEYQSYTYTGFYGLLSGTSGKSKSVSKTSTPERITFIAPHSEIKRTQFYLFPAFGSTLNKKCDYHEVKRSDDTSKLTKVYYVTFEPEQSPLVFRNFITFSTNENFANEFYADNGFYVNKISEMDRRHFSGKYILHPSFSDGYEYPFNDSRYFYVNITRDNAVK